VVSHGQTAFFSFYVVVGILLQYTIKKWSGNVRLELNSLKMMIYSNKTITFQAHLELEALKTAYCNAQYPSLSCSKLQSIISNYPEEAALRIHNSIFWLYLAGNKCNVHNPYKLTITYLNVIYWCPYKTQLLLTIYLVRAFAIGQHLHMQNW